MIMCHNVFHGWPKTTCLLSVWPRDPKRLDTPDSHTVLLAVPLACQANNHPRIFALTVPDIGKSLPAFAPLRSPPKCHVLREILPVRWSKGSDWAWLQSSLTLCWFVLHLQTTKIPGSIFTDASSQLTVLHSDAGGCK